MDKKIWAVLLILFSGCTMFGPRDPLHQTADRLGDIRSGNLTVILAATTAAGVRSGFRLAGPFSLAPGSSLPAADLTYRQFGAEDQKSLGFVSTGKAAYIRVGRQAYKLPEDRVSALRRKNNRGTGGPFARLKIDDWVAEPRFSAGPQIGGTPTQIVRGNLYVATALNNIFDVARELGKRDLPHLEGEEAERLNEAVRSATAELTTETRDRYLRRLSVRVDLAKDAPPELGGEIEKLLGVRFRLSLAIDRPNRPVHIPAPRDPLPLSRLDSSPIP